VVDRFKVSINSQHIVPSWDLETGKPGDFIPVDDPVHRSGRPLRAPGRIPARRQRAAAADQVRRTAKALAMNQRVMRGGYCGVI